MSSEQERRELDERARRGETVVPGGTGGKSLEAQERLAEGQIDYKRVNFALFVCWLIVNDAVD